MAHKKNNPYSIEAIGRRLYLTRLALGKPDDTQLDYADRAGIQRNTYNQYERAKKRILIDNAIRLVLTYQITLDWIYMGNYNGLQYDIANRIKSIEESEKS